MGNGAVLQGVLLLMLLGHAIVPSAQAWQSSGGPSNSATATADGSWPGVDLNVLVRDKRGVPQKVSERELQLFEDGTERQSHFADSADSPVSLALLIDSSGSIYKRKPEILATVTNIIHALPADSEVMGVLFAGIAYIDLPLTPIAKVDLSFLDRLDTRGPSALWDAMVATENHLVANAKYSRRALVILSDGEDNASTLNAQQALRLIEKPGAPMIYACRINDSPGFWNSQGRADSYRGHRILKVIAQWGGGVEIDLGLDPASPAAQIVAAIQDQRVLRFTSAGPTRNGKRHKLELRLPGKDVEIHGLPGFYAPPK